MDILELKNKKVKISPHSITCKPVDGHNPDNRIIKKER